MDKNIEYKIVLWEKLQSIVIENENRNTGTVSVVSIITTGITLYGVLWDSEIINVIFYMLPLLICFCAFIYTFNNRVSALIRGYLAGIEDIINKDIDENIFIQNNSYSELYHIPYFITNDIVSVLYGIVIFLISIVSFENMFKNFSGQRIILILYLIFYIIFLGVCIYELLTNGKIKRIARAYFHYVHDQENDSDEIIFKVRHVKKIMKYYGIK